MQIARFSGGQRQQSSGPLQEIADQAAGGAGPAQRAVVAAIEKRFVDVEDDTNAPLTDAQARFLTKLMTIVSIAAGPPTLAQCDTLARTAAKFDISEKTIDAMYCLARNQRMRFRARFLRHAPPADYLKATRRTQGLGGLLRALLSFRGIKLNPDLSAEFRKLEALPEGTFGRQFAEHYAANGFTWPGEKGGFPVGALFHDIGHLLGGYDTTPEGEMQAASFQAGYRQTDEAFFTMLFGLMIHTAGINLTPFDIEMRPGRIAEGDLAERVFRALERGTKMSVDLGDDWDFRAHFDLPLDEVRRAVGLDAA